MLSSPTLRRVLCKHEFVCIKNFYGTPIETMGYRSLRRCVKCGKEALFCSYGKVEPVRSDRDYDRNANQRTL